MSRDDLMGVLIVAVLGLSLLSALALMSPAIASTALWKRRNPGWTKGWRK